MSDCISAIMESALDKAVELEYSGFGRPSLGGVAKRDFSATRMCEIIKAAITSKFGETEEIKKLQSQISRWLSGAKDRKGGRKERQSGARRRSRSA